MSKNIAVAIVVGTLLAAVPNLGATGSEDADPNVRTVLDDLAQRASELQSYECNLDYVFKQTLLGSQSLRKGKLYYAKFDGRSYLRIDFNTIQQDEEPQRPSREQYFFDGVWLTYIDHELKSVERHQMAEPNAPVDAFTLVNEQVPVVGFSQIDDLENQFEVELLAPSEADPASSYHLHLKAKPDSIYKNDYSTIDFWIDKEQGLPTRIVAAEVQQKGSPEQNIHEIFMTGAKINAGIERSVFAIDIPAEFPIEMVPLNRGNAVQ